MPTARIMTIVKSISAKKIYKRGSEIKKEFWANGYFVNLAEVSKNEIVIKAYIKNQRKEKGFKQFLQQERLDILF